MRQAVILCGGKGTRLGEDFAHLPKPLVPVEGIPLLDHILAAAAKTGVREVLLAAGHLGHLIAERYAAYNPWGLEIHTHIEKQPLGTAGCLHELESRLDADFMLLYGDVFLDFNLNALVDLHEQASPVATVLVRQSDHPQDSDLVDANDQTGEVYAFLPKAKRDPEGVYRNCANAAVYCCSRRLLDFIPRNVSSDIATDAFPAALAGGAAIRAHRLEDTGYVKDMGTPARLTEVERYCRRRKLAREAKNSPRPVRAVILDRDGVLIPNTGLVLDPESVELLPGVTAGMAAMKAAGLVCMVATNQPWIARGLLTEAQLTLVHEALSARIAAGGGFLKDIVYSPYHPETHHGEGVPQMRRASECRKPRPQMLFTLMERHGFHPAETVMIGDSPVDVTAGRNAGVRTILISSLPAEAAAVQPDAVCPDLQAAAECIARWNGSIS